MEGQHVIPEGNKMLSLCERHEQIYQMLKERGGEIPLLQACRIGNMDLVLYISRRHGDTAEEVYQIGEDGFSALYFAVREKNFALATLITLYFLPFRYESQHDRDIVALARRSGYENMVLITNIIITSMSKEYLKKQIEDKKREEENQQFLKELADEEAKKQKQREKKKEQRARAKTRRHIESSSPVSLNTPDFSQFGNDKPERKVFGKELEMKLSKVGMRSRRFRKRFFRLFKTTKPPRQKLKNPVRIHRIQHSISTISLKIGYHDTSETDMEIRLPQSTFFKIPDLITCDEKPLLGWKLYEKRWKERLQNPPRMPLAMGLGEDCSLFTYRHDHSLGMFGKSIFFS